jgi:uncharacterized protein (AIM24 family)
MSAGVPYSCSFCGTPGSGRELSCPACGSPTDVLRVVSPSGWEELPPIPDLARLQIGRSTCQIEGSLVPVADFALDEGDSVYFAHHVLLWTEPHVPLEALVLPGRWSRTLFGMPVVMTMARGPGRIAFSHDEPGELVALPLQPGQAVHVREHTLVAATGDVGYEFMSPTLGMSPGPPDKSGKTHLPVGFLMDRFEAKSRPGLVLAHGGGNVFVRRLAEDETLLIHPSALLFKDSTVDMHLHQEFPAGAGVSGLNSYLWLRLYGPGRVAVRSAYGPTVGERRAVAWASNVTVRRIESATAWYFLRDGQRQGPTTLAYIQGMVLVGRLPQDTQLWSEGLPGWVPARDIGLCSKCGIEQPLVTRKYRPRGVKEWIGFSLVFIPCLPIMLLLLLLSYRYCARCGTMIRTTAGDGTTR